MVRSFRSLILMRMQRLAVPRHTSLIAVSIPTLWPFRISPKQAKATPTFRSHHNRSPHSKCGAEEPTEQQRRHLLVDRQTDGEICLIKLSNCFITKRMPFLSASALHCVLISFWLLYSHASIIFASTLACTSSTALQLLSCPHQGIILCERSSTSADCSVMTRLQGILCLF